MSRSIDREKLLEALNTSDGNVLEKLMSHKSITVRRAVAKNINTPREVLNKLAYDPVLNVSYPAAQNPNCTITRDFSSITHPCILCTRDTDPQNCVNCELLNNFNMGLK
jgi:hypothetical protein